MSTVEYIYTDEKGKPLYKVIRSEPKSFKYQRLDDSGIWQWGLDNTRRVPYRLQELLQADRERWVFLPEGEKDADRLWNEGLVATTNPMGTDNWTDGYAEFLNDRRVAIIPDNDTAGHRHARKVYESIQRVGAPDVRIVNLPGLPDKGDVSYWLDNGGTKDKLLELTDKSNTIEPRGKLFEPVTIVLAGVKAKKICWLWQGRIPLGSVSLIVGNPGLGKSLLTMMMTAHVTTGTPWPDLPDESIPIGSVILVTGEDNLSDVVRPRLDAAGANVNKVFAVEAIIEKDEDGKPINETFFDVSKHIEALDSAIADSLDARLVIIDPISAFLGKTDSHKNAEVRGVLTKLAKLAEKRNIAIVCISHLNKSQKSSANFRIMGSVAFNATARAVWYVVRDDELEGQRLFLPGKSNLTKEPFGLAFNLVSTFNTEVESVKVVFDTEPVYMTPDEALETDANERSSPKIDEAVDWLKDVLKDGPVDRNEIYSLGESNRISGRTIYRAKQKLSVNCEQKGSRGDTKSFWTLQ